MLTLKIIGFLFPFIKEMMLGEKTLKEAIKTNKFRVVIIAGILLSIVVNLFAVPRLLAISAQHIELKRKHDTQAKPPRKPPERSVAVPEMSNTSASPPVSGRVESPDEHDDTTEDEHYRRTKEFFERMQATEAGRRPR